MKSTIAPNHIAFIMDGNRRWAKKRHLPLLAGHHKGAERIEPLVAYAAKRGIRYVTFWAFSSENWERGEKEVGFLMRVFREFIKSSVVNRMMEKGVRVQVIGDIDSFPEDIVKGVHEIVERSKNNKTITAIFALNYGGRKEILLAVSKILRDAMSYDKNFQSHALKFRNSNFEIRNNVQNTNDQNSKQYDCIDENIFSSYLYSSDLPDPDMIVRTGGEMRLSGFLPWQAVYSELYFTDTYWPDFDEEAFEEAIAEYSRRERRFGR